ncbi:hypothetical protein Cgig2_025094 [Carnegiea gigantea]|uniref:Uncharacterized protein n=1 Tax=Carnegiea gigantea TaxID=171969 RepID=A0A9Q1KJR1_9CARY|nr:hypothetical protein Cgig2_025094 [Carnegiea gigantea]
MMISHGYETSTSELRMLGVEEYSQLHHEGVHRTRNLFGFPGLILSGDACYRPTINKGREARELRMAALHLGTGTPMQLLQGPHQVLRRDSARDTLLCNFVHDYGEDSLQHFGDGGVWAALRSHAGVKTWTEDEVILREWPRTLGQGGHALRLGVTVGHGRGLYTVSTRQGNLGIFKLVLIRQQPRFNDVPSQLP